MAAIRSRLVRRGQTGRKATGTRRVRRRVTVHHRHHRRYAGIRGGPRRKPSRRHATVHHRSARRQSVRHKSTARRKPALRHKSTHRHISRQHGLKHPHKGVHGHHAFHGRRKTTHRKALKSANRGYTPPPAITGASYLSMF